jgi:hypothetical protein
MRYPSSVLLPVDLGRLGRDLDFAELDGYLREYLLQLGFRGRFRFRVRVSRSRGVEYAVRARGLGPVVIRPTSLEFHWFLRHAQELGVLRGVSFLHSQIRDAEDLYSLIEGIERDLDRGAGWLRAMDRGYVGRLLTMLHWLRGTGLFDVRFYVRSRGMRLSVPIQGILNNRLVLIDVSRVPGLVCRIYTLGILRDITTWVKASPGMKVVVMIDDAEALLGDWSRRLVGLIKEGRVHGVGYVVGHGGVGVGRELATGITVEELINELAFTANLRGMEIRGALP